MLKSFIVAFAMYSGLPMPCVRWDEDSLKNVLVFFPAVGLFLGGVLFLESFCLKRLGAYPPLATSLLLYTAYKVTGGIHLDGFMDVADASGSWGDREKKLAIMSDSHVGAFAVMALLLYGALLYGAVSGLYRNGAHRGLFLIPALSRALSGYALSRETPAKDSGLAYLFHSAADKKRVGRVLFCETCVLTALLVKMAGLGGVCAAGSMAISYGRYIHRSRKVYGGITGDLAGDFLCRAEGAALVLSCLLGGI